MNTYAIPKKLRKAYLMKPKRYAGSTVGAGKPQVTVTKQQPQKKEKKNGR